MISMQYKIQLPNDYNMDIIKQRIINNGNKTDNFEDLLFKAYMFIDTPTKKQYAPFYVWKKQNGMNKFIFDGFYDNILGSFGWQQINVFVPIDVDLRDDFIQSKQVLEIETEIKETSNMLKPTFHFPNEDCLGKIIVYNPSQWKYIELYFYKKIPVDKENLDTIYQTLHISM